MKRYTILTTVAICGLFVCGAEAQKNEANRLVESSDRTFVSKAAQGGMAEVELGRLATERASNEKVKHFGQQMVDDHSKANEELKNVASNKGTQLPTSMDAQSQATLKHLSNLHGAAFDRAYIDDMVKDHQKDVADFQREAEHGTDPDVKAFAAKTLPTLQHHLQMAQDARSAVK